VSYINPLAIPSHFPPIQGSLPHSSAAFPLRFILRTNHFQWTLPQTPKPSARNSSWLCRACLAPCLRCHKHGALNKSRYTPPPCLLNSLLRAKPRYAASSAGPGPTHPCLPPSVIAPQSTFKIRHSVSPIIDRDAPAQPSVVSVSSTDDEGVWPQFRISQRAPFLTPSRVAVQI